MKLLIWTTSLFFLLLLIACNQTSENSIHLSSVPQGCMISVSDCKLHKATNLVNVIDTLTCTELSYNKETRYLQIKHVNSGLNCCFDSVYCDIVTSGDTIKIIEKEGNPSCSCLCLFDVVIEIKDLNPGKYVFVFEEPYSQKQEPLKFEHDFVVSQQESYCVVRKEYPWGN